jgi:hypothetical protein
LGQTASQPGLTKTVSDRVHPTHLSIAALNPVEESILTPN